MSIFGTEYDKKRSDEAAAGWAEKQRKADMRVFKPGMGSVGLDLPGDIKLNEFDVGNPYQAKDVSGALPEFEKLRNDVASQNSTAKSDAMGALERKFAAMGNLNSGAYLKQSNLLDSRYNQEGNKALNDVGFQEAAARRQLQEAEANRAFQSGEAQAGRKFQASAQGRQDAITQSQNKFSNAAKLRELDMALFKVQNDSLDSQFNAEMAKYQAEHSGGLFGGGGFLGLGI